MFTNGVFDLLHRGHVTYLAQARELGAALLVALNGDASARRLGKGEGRPVNGLEDRMTLVAALQSVDAVTWFEEDTPVALIEALRVPATRVSHRVARLCAWLAPRARRRGKPCATIASENTPEFDDPIRPDFSYGKAVKSSKNHPLDCLKSQH